MLKPPPFKKVSQHGFVLAGAFIVSMALAILIMGISTLSKYNFRQAFSHLSRTHLRRMAQEKWRQSLVHLQNNPSLENFKAAGSTNPKGRTHASAEWVQSPHFGRALYLVVTATATGKNIRSPKHLKLQTLLKFQTPKSVSRHTLPAIEELQEEMERQLRKFVSDDHPSFEEIRNHVMASLESQLAHLIQTSEYRGPRDSALEPESDDTFTLTPLLVSPLTNSPRIQLWREDYY